MRRFTFSCLSLLLGASFTSAYGTCLEELRNFDISRLKKASEPEENDAIPSSALMPEEPTPLRLVVSADVLLEMRAKLKAPSLPSSSLLSSSSSQDASSAPEVLSTSPTQTMAREERAKLLRKQTMSMITSQPKLAPATHERQKIPDEVLDRACYKAYEELKQNATALLTIERDMKRAQENLNAHTLKKQRLDEYLHLLADAEVQENLQAAGAQSRPFGLSVREKMAHFSKVQNAFYAEELENIPLLQRTTDEGIAASRGRIADLSARAHILRTQGARFNKEVGNATLCVQRTLTNKSNLHAQLGSVALRQSTVAVQKEVSALIVEWEEGCMEELQNLNSKYASIGSRVQGLRDAGYTWFVHYHSGASLRRRGADENMPDAMLHKEYETLCGVLKHISNKWGFAPYEPGTSEPPKSPREMDVAPPVDMSEVLSSMIILDPGSFYGFPSAPIATEEVSSYAAPSEAAPQASEASSWQGWLHFLSQRMGLGLLMGKEL